MSYNEAETRFYLIDPVLRGKGYNEHWKLKLETPAPVEPTGQHHAARPVHSSPTKKIWYYDLSHVKVGKKTPMTLAHFGWGPNGEVLYDPALPATLVSDWAKQDGNEGKPFPTFARLISHHGLPEAESDFSWTVDFMARRAKARDDMAPHLDEVEKRINEAMALKDKIATFKRAKASEANIESCREELALVGKAQRKAQAKADTIDAATFDLKAVNPRACVIRDTRSVGEILESIERHGQMVQESLATLRKQLVEG